MTGLVAQRNRPAATKLVKHQRARKRGVTNIKLKGNSNRIAPTACVARIGEKCQRDGVECGEQETETKLASLQFARMYVELLQYLRNNQVMRRQKTGPQTQPAISNNEQMICGSRGIWYFMSTRYFPPSIRVT
ncbi:uncharacterized protein MELLADRAFT_112447 [Melampsora larici-populina 98AG31]|uniref:Uncharacterized protein n=1 Tax=Melampsora larici-populina (strain 98AG31 / pathotype 3-4-7) TaxID=747676 RepID=F4S6I2_MELLP|nr:uncharacterized protein MELLADRAFT_112447 [Melampsora larici-populina 98AG31]EGF99693.1 hypothetical protein MELLADRAFT_112447 [Melampsora larici-populina 98AG31]